MPEGDTIFRSARTLHAALAGKAVTRFQSALAHIAVVDDNAPIVGRTIEAVTARGKHLLMRFSGDLTLRTHMLMSGSWHIYRPGEKWLKPQRAMRIVVGTEDFVAVAFDVPVARFHTARALARQRDLAQLGPDVLGSDFDPAEAVRRIRARDGATIAEALLNQRVIAGIGNVFKSEILFGCGINPFADAASLSEEKCRALTTMALRFMKANITASNHGSIVTYFGFRRTTGRTDPGERLWVYGRHGKPCRKCGTPIEMRKHGIDARVTWWCPGCQPAAG